MSPRNPGPPEQRPLTPEVMVTLSAAIDRRRRPHRRVWRRRGFFAGLVTVAVAGTATAASVWNPFGQQGNEDKYTLSSLPQDHAAHLGVLRRGQSSADTSPLISSFLRMYTGRGERVYVRYVRYLRDVDTANLDGSRRRASMVLIPQIHSGFQVARHRFPEPRDLLCVMLIEKDRPESAVGKPASAGGGACADYGKATKKGMSFGLASAGILTGIVPDGVSAVRMTTADGRLVEDEVVSNGFQLLSPDFSKAKFAADRDLPPPSRLVRSTLEWKMTDGSIVEP